MNAIALYDCEYVNLGEDMGIPGIITDKTLLRPCGKIKKYTVSVL
jgi:predicted nucleic acid-binding protein